MNRYEPEVPRAAFGIAAAALTAITIGLLVVAPAQFDSISTDSVTLAAARGAATPATEVVISPARVDVVAVRETALVRTAAADAEGDAERNVSWALAGDTKPNCKPST